jgi:NAD-dependent dihydropyrimidine dehydrogenase PreA subunit
MVLLPGPSPVIFSLDFHPRRESDMTYVIAQPCIGVKDASCVEVCPVDCIYEGEEMYYIHPDECIECAACEPECPVDAIFAEEDVPPEWRNFIQINADFFANK